MIILDTNVVSELMRASPAREVVAWVRAHADDQLATTAVTVAEIRYGLARMPEDRRADELRRLADRVLGAFPDDVLPFDADAATHYGALVADRERAGRPISALDAQIAAICRAHGAAIATRNGRDFTDTGLEVVDPWTR